MGLEVWSLFYKGTFMRVPPVWTNHLPHIPLPSSIVSGIEFQNTNFGGHRHSVYGTIPAQHLLFCLFRSPLPAMLCYSLWWFLNPLSIFFPLTVRHVKPICRGSFLLHGCHNTKGHVTTCDGLLSHFHSLIHSVNIYWAPTMFQTFWYWHDKPFTLLTPDWYHLNFLSITVISVPWCRVHKGTHFPS